MDHDVIEARYVRDHVIWLRFRGGTVGEVDLVRVRSPAIARARAAPLHGETSDRSPSYRVAMKPLSRCHQALRPRPLRPRARWRRRGVCRARAPLRGSRARPHHRHRTEAGRRRGPDQEAFFRAHTKLDTYRSGTSFPAWVTRIGKNAALDYVKLRRLDTVPLRGSPDATTDKALKALGFQVPNPTSDPSTARELDERRFRFALEHALRRLDRTDRRCFLMHVAEERSFEEISRREGLPAGTVKTNVRRARLQLREMLQPWLGTDASPGPATQA